MVSESRAIANYLCTLAGKPELHAGHKDLVEFLQLDAIINDTFWEITRAAYICPTMDLLKTVYGPFAGKHKGRYEEIGQIVKERGFVLGGDQASFLDLFLAELTEKAIAMEKDVGIVVLSGLEGHKEHLERVLAIPQIKAYREKNEHGLVGAYWNAPGTCSWK